jgi:hypothetical protein
MRMNHFIRARDLDQLKINLLILKNKISLAQDFLKQVSDEADHLQEVIFDQEEREFDQLYYKTHRRD